MITQEVVDRFAKWKMNQDDHERVDSLLDAIDRMTDPDDDVHALHEVFERRDDETNPVYQQAEVRMFYAIEAFRRKRDALLATVTADDHAERRLMARDIKRSRVRYVRRELDKSGFRGDRAGFHMDQRPRRAQTRFEEFINSDWA